MNTVKAEFMAICRGTEPYGKLRESGQVKYLKGIVTHYGGKVTGKESKEQLCDMVFQSIQAEEARLERQKHAAMQQQVQLEERKKTLESRRREEMGRREMLEREQNEAAKGIQTMVERVMEEETARVHPVPLEEIVRTIATAETRFRMEMQQTEREVVNVINALNVRIGETNRLEFMNNLKTVTNHLVTLLQLRNNITGHIADTAATLTRHCRALFDLEATVQHTALSKLQKISRIPNATMTMKDFLASTNVTLEHFVHQLVAASFEEAHRSCAGVDNRLKEMQRQLDESVERIHAGIAGKVNEISQRGYYRNPTILAFVTAANNLGAQIVVEEEQLTEAERQVADSLIAELTSLCEAAKGGQQFDIGRAVELFDELRWSTPTLIQTFSDRGSGAACAYVDELTSQRGYQIL